MVSIVTYIKQVSLFYNTSIGKLFRYIHNKIIRLSISSKYLLNGFLTRDCSKNLLKKCFILLHRYSYLQTIIISYYHNLLLQLLILNRQIIYCFCNDK